MKNTFHDFKNLVAYENIKTLKKIILILLLLINNQYN